MTASTLNDDLISWWAMNDCPTESQSDEMRRTKLIGSGLTQITGLQGNAVEFASDGTSRLYAASNSLLQLASRPFTIAVWVKFDSLTDSPVILSKTDADPVTAQFRLEYDSFTQAITFRVGNAILSNGTFAFNSTTPPLGVWHFILAWLDAEDGFLHIRMNNSNYDNVSTNMMVGGGMAVNISNFTIGSDPDGSHPLDGAVDSVAVWGRVLTRTEQMLLFNRGRGANFCALEELDCKSVVCCDLPMFAYQSNTASESDGGRSLRLPLGIAPVITPGEPALGVVYDPCAAIRPLTFLSVFETGKSIGWQSRWPGIAYCDSLDRVIAESTADDGIALINFAPTTPVVDYVLPLTSPYELRGIMYHPKADVIIAFVRYGTSPTFSYRLSFLHPVNGFSSDVILGIPGGSNSYEAFFTPITFRTIGVLIRSLTNGNPHLIAVVDVESRTVLTSAFFQNTGGTVPTRDFYGLTYSCQLGQLISIANRFDGVEFFKNYLVRMDVSTLSITHEFLLPATPVDIRDPIYITSTGHVFGWDVLGPWDIQPATGVAVQFDSLLTGNVKPIYQWRTDRWISLDGGNSRVLLYDPVTKAKQVVPITTTLGDSWNMAVSRSDGRFYVHDGLFFPFLIREINVA